MNYRELSEAFDIYSNRYALEKGTDLIPFDEYEKSLFITRSAEEIVRELLPFYDRNEKIKKQLLSITNTAELVIASGIDDSYRYRAGTLFYELPSGVEYITLESLKSSVGAVIRRIKPLPDDETSLTLISPFRASKYGYAFKLSLSIGDKKYSEIITDLTSASNPKYYLKYISSIPAFVVTEFLENASVKGVSSNSDLEAEAPLAPLHEKILSRAVLIGYVSRTDDPNAKATAANLSSNS